MYVMQEWRERWDGMDGVDGQSKIVYMYVKGEGGRQREVIKMQAEWDDKANCACGLVSKGEM